MRQILLFAAVVVLAGCGADTMNSAATAALLKKQEIEQGKKTLEQAQQKIGEAMKQVDQRAQHAGDDGVK